ncbi:MAG: hypothetical protein QOI08_1794 [Actinomycetota bacterium]|nr:hypothetical protein [Actinomycetota bacterium]
MHAISLRARVFAGVAALALLSSVGISAAANGKPSYTKFSMLPQASFLNCVKPHPSSPAPTVTVKVKRDDLNDRATVELKGFKPNLDFDLFTIQHSPQTATGAADPNSGVGLAWYQSDLHVGSKGSGHAKIRTILLDQIFGLDKDVALAPTNTFHLGFWFNNPADAKSCGFTGMTPFNGEHTAGPLAFVTRPSARTGLGPLCLDPTSGSEGIFTCNP